MHSILLHDVNHPSATEAWFTQLVSAYPRHKDYGIDYSDAVDCPIVTCAVYYADEVLLTKRSQHVMEYPGYWALVGGFMAGPAPIITALTELQEELKIYFHDIAEIRIASRRMRLDPAMRQDVEFSAPYRRRWFEFRVAVRLSRRVTPGLNDENVAARWFTQAEALTLPMLPSSRRTLLAWQRVGKFAA